MDETNVSTMENASGTLKEVFMSNPLYIVGVLAIILLLIAMVVIMHVKQYKISLDNGEGEPKKGSSNKPTISESHKSSKTKGLSPEDIRVKLINNKLFVITFNTYLSSTMQFSMYDRLLAHSIKHEHPKVTRFKKQLANFFISRCLFVYLKTTLLKWIDETIDSCKSSDIKNKTPVGLYNIGNMFLSFGENVKAISSRVEFTFDGKIITQLPEAFINTFIGVVNDDINTLYQIIHSALYDDSNDWYTKATTILELFEVLLILIKTRVDATLVLLNGEMEKYVKSIFPECFKDEEPAKTE